jgi:hypothetical protein
MSGGGVGRALADAAAAARAVAQAVAEGNDAPLRAFTLDLIAAFARDDATRRSFYAQERRWPDAPFWRRRLQAATRGENSARPVI